MAAIENGRICVVKAGRRIGEEVVVTKIVDGNFVIASAVSGKGKERKFSMLHLEPTNRKQ